MDKALNQLAEFPLPHPDLLRRHHCQQAQVFRYIILKEKFEDSALITQHIAGGQADSFITEYQIVLQIHPVQLEVFLYFWWKIRHIR
jgi:hypothetical protein